MLTSPFDRRMTSISQPMGLFWNAYRTYAALVEKHMLMGVTRHYPSSITGTTQTLGLVRIRPPTPAGPAWIDVLAERAIVHVTGTFFAQTGCHPSLLDAVHTDVIYSSRSCHHIAIAFPPSHIYAVGTITTEQYYVSPTFSALPLTISQRLGWGENFRPRVRMQPLTVFPHRTDLPPQLSHPA